VAAFKDGLAERAYTEGRNVAIEYRWGGDRYDRLPEMAADLVRRHVAVIMTAGGPSTAFAAKVATSSIPIVFISGTDPVDSRLASNLSRPDANLTGVVCGFGLGVCRAPFCGGEKQIRGASFGRSVCFGWRSSMPGVATSPHSGQRIASRRQFWLAVPIYDIAHCGPMWITAKQSHSCVAITGVETAREWSGRYGIVQEGRAN
jgi:hypothetical protein